jgi:hypothetical protein
MSVPDVSPIHPPARPPQPVRWPLGAPRPSGELVTGAGDFDKRRAAARRQAAYARRRRLGQIKVAVVVTSKDLHATGRRRGLVGISATRQELEQVRNDGKQL